MSHGGVVRYNQQTVSSVHLVLMFFAANFHAHKNVKKYCTATLQPYSFQRYNSEQVKKPHDVIVQT